MGQSVDQEQVARNSKIIRLLFRIKGVRRQHQNNPLTSYILCTYVFYDLLPNFPYFLTCPSHASDPSTSYSSLYRSSDFIQIQFAILSFDIDINASAFKELWWDSECTMKFGSR